MLVVCMQTAVGQMKLLDILGDIVRRGTVTVRMIIGVMTRMAVLMHLQVPICRHVIKLIVDVGCCHIIYQWK